MFLGVFKGLSSWSGIANSPVVFNGIFLMDLLIQIGRIILVVGVLLSCTDAKSSSRKTEEAIEVDSLASPIESEPILLTSTDIVISKELLFDKYTPEDVYEYRDTVRSFDWDEIKRYLAIVENHHDRPERWGVLQNYKNMNREAPLVHTWHRDSHKLVADSLGIQRYQSVPLYSVSDSVVPMRYGRDGSPFHLLDSIGSFYKLNLMDSNEEWLTLKRYVKILPDTVRFDRVVFVDLSDQNITTLERRARGEWMVRSMNPATTGKHNPPYGHATPPGIFMIQQKKRKMFYHKDGSSELAGYAPYASRFTNGAYIHGVPVNNVNGKEIEYSQSLGTTPRSHMCVRNASSHAQFVYDWAPIFGAFVIVIE